MICVFGKNIQMVLHKDFSQKIVFVDCDKIVNYRRYMEDFGADNIKTQHKSTVKLALFGIGRAGTIHLASIISNPRVKLSYIVDAVEHNLQRTRLHWHLEDVTFLNCEQSDKVFEDPE